MVPEGLGMWGLGCGGCLAGDIPSEPWWRPARAASRAEGTAVLLPLLLHRLKEGTPSLSGLFGAGKRTCPKRAQKQWQDSCLPGGVATWLAFALGCRNCNAVLACCSQNSLSCLLRELHDDLRKKGCIVAAAIRLLFWDGHIWGHQVL